MENITLTTTNQHARRKIHFHKLWGLDLHKSKIRFENGCADKNSNPGKNKMKLKQSQLG